MLLLTNWLIGVAMAATSTLSLFEPGSHCVAYKAQKTTLMFKGGDVVGKNCDISAQVLPEVGGLFYIEVNIPIRSFKSDDTDRDEDVAKALKVDTRAEITFKSKAKTSAQWRDLFAKKDFPIDGELTIGEKSYPIRVDSRYIDAADKTEVDGVAKVHFQDFDITPPKVAGGLVAKSKPELELHFHLQASRILGADSIRLGKAPDPLEKEQK